MRLYLGILGLLALAVSSSWGAIAFVQAKACRSSPATFADCSYTSQVVPGNFQVVACMGNRLNASLSVTDDQNDSFTLVGGTLTTGAPSGGTLVWGIWYSTGAVGDYTTVTCSDDYSNTTWIEMSIHEYSGVMTTTDPFDVTTSTSGTVLFTTTTIIANSMLPSRNGSLIFAIAPQMPSAALAGNGNIRTNTVDNTYWATEDFIQDTAAVYQSSFTHASASQIRKISQVSFKPPIPGARGIEISQ